MQFPIFACALLHVDVCVLGRHSGQSVESDAEDHTLQGTQKAINPALVDYFFQFVCGWHHTENFQSLMLKMVNFLQSK